MSTVGTGSTAAVTTVGIQYAESVADGVNVYDGYNNILGAFVGEVTTATPVIVLTESTGIADILSSFDATGFGNIYFMLNGDIITITAAQRLTLAGIINEWLGAVDPLVVQATVYMALQDLITLKAFAEGIYTRGIAETVTFTASAFSILSIIITSILRASDAGTTLLNGISVLREAIKIDARLIQALSVVLSESTGVSDSVALLRRVLATTTSKLKVADVAGVITQLYNAVSEQIGAAATALGAKGASISEIWTATATLRDQAIRLALMLEALTVTDTAVTVRLVVMAVGETVTMIDPPTGQTFDPQQLLQALIQDQVSFGIGYIASNGIWTGWTLNATTQAVSNYAGWDFNSFTKFRGQYLGASNTQGIASLGGAQDGTAAITATLQSAVTDFGNSFLKRVKMAYIGMNANGTATFSTTTDDNVERVYQLVPDAPGLHTERVQLARGVMSRYWTFTLQAVGADFRVDEISLLPVTLERRI